MVSLRAGGEAYGFVGFFFGLDTPDDPLNICTENKENVCHVTRCATNAVWMNIKRVKVVHQIK